MRTVSTDRVRQRSTHLDDLIPQCLCLVVLLIYKIEEGKVSVFSYITTQQHSSEMCVR